MSLPGGSSPRAADGRIILAAGCFHVCCSIGGDMSWRAESETFRPVARWFAGLVCERSRRTAEKFRAVSKWVMVEMKISLKLAARVADDRQPSRNFRWVCEGPIQRHATFTNSGQRWVADSSSRRQLLRCGVDCGRPPGASRPNSSVTLPTSLFPIPACPTSPAPWLWPGPDKNAPVFRSSSVPAMSPR